VSARRALLVLFGVLAATSPAAAEKLFILVHGPDGRQAAVNVKKIASFNPVRPGHWAPNVRCLIHMEHGKFIPATESCSEVGELIAAVKI